MPKAASKLVTLVPSKGVTLPVSECLLKKEAGDEFLVSAVAKEGRGRGTKYFLRTFRIPKASVAYLYRDEEITADAVDGIPLAKGTRATAAKKTTATAAAPKKRGRPPKAKTEDAPKKKRGRPPKAKTEDAPKKKRGRPPKAKPEDAPKKKRGRPPKAKPEDAPKKKRGRPPKKKTEDAAPKKKRGRPPKKAAEAAPKKEKNNKIASLFDDDF